MVFMSPCGAVDYKYVRPAIDRTTLMHCADTAQPIFLGFKCSHVVDYFGIDKKREMMDEETAKIEAQRSFPPLDESRYNLRPQDAALFKELTGIEDDDALKDHILKVQAKAYKVAVPFNKLFCP